MESSQSDASSIKDAPDRVANRYTNLRTTNLTNLIEPAPCIHETTADRCAVCSGFVRWLIADKDRMRRAETDPGAVRREFWRAVRGDSL